MRIVSPDLSQRTMKFSQAQQCARHFSLDKQPQTIPLSNYPRIIDPSRDLVAAICILRNILQNNTNEINWMLKILS